MIFKVFIADEIQIPGEWSLNKTLEATEKVRFEVEVETYKFNWTQIEDIFHFNF